MWRAQISIANVPGGKAEVRCLGSFPSALEAAQVIAKAKGEGYADYSPRGNNTLVAPGAAARSRPGRPPNKHKPPNTTNLERPPNPKTTWQRQDAREEVEEADLPDPCLCDPELKQFCGENDQCVNRYALIPLCVICFAWGLSAKLVQGAPY